VLALEAQEYDDGSDDWLQTKKSAQNTSRTITIYVHEVIYSGQNFTVFHSKTNLYSVSVLYADTQRILNTVSP